MFLQAVEDDEGSAGLLYCPVKSSHAAEKTNSSKSTLLSSHLLSNGAVGNDEEIVEGKQWLCVCMNASRFDCVNTL